MFRRTFTFILAVSLMILSTAVASESGFFGELAQVEYADERLPALEKAAEQVPASSLTRNGITVELGQGYCEGNRVFVSFKISANTDLIELYEGAPDAEIKWRDSMENMIIGEEPAPSPDVKKQYDWLDGKSQHWLRVPSCSAGDGLELEDGTYLDIVAGYQKKQADGTILGWEECMIPEGKESDTLTFKVPFCWYTMIRFQDYTTYRETIESSENDSIRFTLNRNNSFRYLQGASQAASYQAAAEVVIGNVDIKGTIRIVSPEQAASWIAWQEGEEGTGTDVISCWNLYQNGELVSADLYGASEVIGTDEVIFEVIYPHMDDISGLSLVPEYSEGGEKPDEAIALEPGHAAATPPQEQCSERTEDEIIALLRDHCFIYPNGGRYAHLDQYCRSVNPKYLPLNEVEYTDEIAQKYEFCPVCCIYP